MRANFRNSAARPGRLIHKALGYLACAGATIGCAPTNPPNPSDVPSKILLFIGDGVGISYWTAARFALDSLAIEAFPVGGVVDTQSASHRVTDSGAAATAYSAGVRTYNRAIGMGLDSAPVPTVLERARGHGQAVGIVATSSVTHATPASFVAHVVDRRQEFEIARQMVEALPNVVLGGGAQFFGSPARPDSMNLLNLVPEGTRMIWDRAAMREAASAGPEYLVGLFAQNGMPVAANRTPTLPEMTAAALTVLDRNPNGWFLMVEASQPDWQGHGNATLEDLTAEMVDFNAAIYQALAYQREHPETLIVIVADHETGGLAIDTDATGRVRASYTSQSHTAEFVPMFAKGPGAWRFGGFMENHQVGRVLLDLVASSADLRARGR